MEEIKIELIKRIEQYIAIKPAYKVGITYEKKRHEFIGKCVNILNKILEEKKFDASRKEELVNFITPTIISLTNKHLDSLNTLSRKR